MTDPKVATVPLTKVGLYKHGIGYFERRGTVKGPCEIELMCGPDEIDDMLKSLVVLDKTGKKISAVTYESAKTLENRLEEFGFDLRTCRGLIDLVVQIKGAPVTVEVGKEIARGRVIGLDEVKQISKDTVSVEFLLVLYTDAKNLRRISLASINKISVDDDALASEIQQQLELLFQAARKKDRKLLKVQISDAGPSDVTMAYSIPCPIWKTSYRLVWTEEDKLFLHGSAIVDNSQEEDWDKVQMTLVSAAPVSFIQPLFDPVQPERPVIEAQGFQSSGPFVAERGNALMKIRGQSKAAGAPESPSAGAWGAAAPMQSAPGGGPRGGGVVAAGLVADIAGMGGTGALELAVSSQQVGELFEYRIDEPVTVPANSSALITVVMQAVEGERVSLFNEQRHRKHPYASLRLKNTTGLTLEAGPVTVMENGAYAGEALLDVLKPDDSRFLPYALDQSVHIICRQEHGPKMVWRARCWQGYLHIEFKETRKRSYIIENVSDKEKVVYIEHPVTPSLRYVGDDRPMEITEHFYRFKGKVEGKTTKVLGVPEEWDGFSQILLEDFSSAEPAEFKWLMAQSFVDDKFVAFLKEVSKLRVEILQLSVAEKDLNDQLKICVTDEERARENVRTLGGGADRYRKAIDEAEDRIAELEKERREVVVALQSKRAELNTLVQQQIHSELAAPTVATR